jgi:hypothetical protein
MDLSSIEQIIRTQVPNAPDSDVELYLDSVQRDMKFGGDYSDMSEDDIVEDFEFYIQSRMDEAQKPSMKMKKSELKEMIKAAFLSEADFTNAQDDDAAPAVADMYDPVYEGEDEEESLDDILARVMGTKADPYMAEDLNEAEEEEEEEVDIDVKDTDLSSDDEEVESKNDSIVVDKKIVSLSSLPSETRKILDTLETLRAQAEEFGDQKFITQVGNTITFLLATSLLQVMHQTQLVLKNQHFQCGIKLNNKNYDITRITRQNGSGFRNPNYRTPQNS